MADKFSVRLEDSVYGRVVLVEEVANTAAQAESAAAASPGVSGPTSSFAAKRVVSQASVLSVTGTDPSGNPVSGSPATPASTLPPTLPS